MYILGNSFCSIKRHVISPDWVLIMYILLVAFNQKSVQLILFLLRHNFLLHHQSILLDVMMGKSIKVM